MLQLSNQTLNDGNRMKRTDTIAQTNVMPTLKNKMSQYMFETKQNPLHKTPEGDQKHLSSIFKNLNIFKKPSESLLPPLPSKPEIILTTDLNERAGDESLNVSMKMTSEISDSESIHEAKKSPMNRRRSRRSLKPSLGRNSSRLSMSKKASLIVEKHS